MPQSDRRHLAGRARWLASVVLSSLLAACATAQVTSTQYVGAPTFPPTSPATVVVLRHAPKMPHVRLGEIDVDASTDPAPPVSEVEQKLREAGAKLGANAVVVVHDHLQRAGSYVSGPWWGRTVVPITARKVIAVAIRYQ